MVNKKLIEVALPLDKINTESAREKSIRHGHPSTLHLWWARRPLATARAIIWSSIIDDPSSHPEKYPTEEEQSKERQRLFKILEALVEWENINDEAVIGAAKQEILKATNGNPPIFLDPFSGGGAIPLEAHRLGLETHAHDLNPIPVMLNKAMLEYPVKFAGYGPANEESNLQIGNNWEGITGIVEDIKFYGKWILKEAALRTKGLYPKIKLSREYGDEEVPVIAWIWARTVKCPNPVCGAEMPLIKSSVLAKNIAYIDVEVSGNSVNYLVKKGTAERDICTVSRKGATCVCCGAPVSFNYIREEGKKHRLNKKLVAIIAKGKKGRVYLTPTTEQELAAENVPPTNIELGILESYPGYINPPAYGIEEITELFTHRQLFTLNTFCDLVALAREKVEIDAKKCGFKDDHMKLCDGGTGAKAYGEAISVYLAFMVDKLADYNSTICSWNPSREGLRNTFGLTGMSMSWDFAEANPFSGASGCFENMINWVAKCIALMPYENMGEARCFNAQEDSGLRDALISTDPPYYSNVPYADFADFFYVWLRKSMGDVYPNLFATMQTPKKEELVADPYRAGGKEKAAEFFENGMLKACKAIYKSASNEYPVTIYYAYKQSDSDAENAITSSGWETMLTAIIEAGFEIDGTWPVRTEKPGRSRGKGANALASSIVLVCRKRDENAPQTTRRSFISTLHREFYSALKKLQDSNIAPVDLAQSAIGPGMGVFSQYKRVLEADGTPMSVRSALQIINEEIDLYFNEQIGSMDTASRFCVDLYTQCAYNDIKYGEAEVLANAKGTSIPMMASHGVLYAKAGVVHLVERDSLPEKVDSNEGNIWMLTQQLTRSMATGGVENCAQIVFNMFGSNAENAKDLAYRLYTIAESKGWANEAYAYNALVVAWPDIQTKAAELKAIQPEQMSLFDLGYIDKK